MAKDPETTTQPAPRYQVHLQVRFLKARDFLLEYAENLSEGGLFIVGPQHLEPLDEVTIHIDLPGFGGFDVDCCVAHVLTEEEAAKHDRKPGAGFIITSAPHGFEQRLADYLRLLGSRKECTVYVASRAAERFLTTTGYNVVASTDADTTAAAIADADTDEVVAVVVTQPAAARFRTALDEHGLSADLLLIIDASGPPDDILATLDNRILSLRKDRDTGEE